MTMLSTTLQQTSIDLSKNVRKETVAALQLWPKEYDFIVENERSTYRTEKLMGYEGTGALPELEEDADPTSKAVVEGYTESATHKQYMQEMPVSYLMQLFADSNRVVPKLIGQYNSRSAMLRLEYTPADILNS